MKFLCVPCDSAMKLERTQEASGSFSLIYACPACGYECAMLTNPMETEVVRSLGVRIGAAGGQAGASRCPFTGIVQATAAAAALPAGVAWTPAAEARMAAVPEFVRPMVRRGIESFARERGHACVDESVLDAARESFGLDRA
jgi:hypothetical protein